MYIAPANTPESRDCKDSKFMYPAAGHIMTGNLKIISDSRIRYIVSKGPKYRFPSRIDFKKCREEIASALNDFGNRWCKREYVEPDALKEWKVNKIQKLSSFKSNENIRKREDGSYYVVSANKASSVTL